MDEIVEEVQRNFQANSGNVMTAKEAVQVFGYARNMNKHLMDIVTLAEKAKEADPAEVQKLVENIVDVCKDCNKAMTIFADGAKSITDTFGGLVERFSPATGQAIKDTCADFLDQACCAKQTALIQEQLQEHLVQQTITQENILGQIQQQKQHINKSIQSAYEFASYINFVTALFNFGMAIATLKQTCELIQQHKKIMDEEKAKLEKCGNDLKNYHDEIEELIEIIKSINPQNLNSSESIHQRLYELSDSIREIQLDLERIKSRLNIAVYEVRSQKKQHIAGVWAGGIGAVVSTATTIGQIANIWNMGAITLNILGSVASGIGIKKCQNHIDSLQQLTENTEMLIHNANENMKLIKSAKELLKEKPQKDLSSATINNSNQGEKISFETIQMAGNGPEWIPMDWNGWEWIKMDPNELECLKMSE